MRYETFLFTRNRERDFTAFVRPASMTNKDVSAIANAFNYINDVTALTPALPGLYAFPLGAYTYVLRHTDSGRRHAGREIGVIEGIAVAKDERDALREALPHIVAHHASLLDIAGKHDDIEKLTARPSPEYEWSEDSDSPEQDTHAEDNVPEEPLLDETGRATLDDFATRFDSERLILPFSETGYTLLLTALLDDRLPPLAFAFGTNSEVVAALANAGVEIDIVGTMTAQQPGLRTREIRRAPAPQPVPVAVPQPIAPSPHDIPPPPAPRRPTLVRLLLRWLLGGR
jgi:hypothetical protein